MFHVWRVWDVLLVCEEDENTVLYSRDESVPVEVEKEVVLPVMSREIEALGLPGRVQHGLTPMKLCVSIWLGSLAPKVMLKWESISWWRRFWAVRGLSRGWTRPPLDFFSFFFCFFSSLALSLLDELPPKVRTRARREVVLSRVEELWLVLLVAAVVLDSVWVMVLEASDLRRARRTRSRIAILVVCDFVVM